MLPKTKNANGRDFKFEVIDGLYKIDFGLEGATQKDKVTYNKDGSVDKRHTNKIAGVSSEVYAFNTQEEIKAMIDVLNKHINEAMFGEFLISFFKTENDSDLYVKYMEASSSGVARNPSIVARHNALEESYKEFFKIEENNVKIS